MKSGAPSPSSEAARRAGVTCCCAGLASFSLCSGWEMPGLTLARRTRPGLLMCQKCDLLEQAHRNQWLPCKDSQVCYRLV